MSDYDYWDEYAYQRQESLAAQDPGNDEWPDGVVYLNAHDWYEARLDLGAVSDILSRILEDQKLRGQR